MTDADVEWADRVRSVYDAEHARLWRSVYGFTRSREVSDEAVAETFAQVLGRGRAVRDVRAWVWRTAFAIARGELRRRSSDAVRPAADPPDRQLPEADVVADDDLSRLLARLARLSDDDREVLMLCHVGGWRPAELAPILDVRAATLRVRLHRATARARHLLEADGE